MGAIIGAVIGLFLGFTTGFVFGGVFALEHCDNSKLKDSRATGESNDQSPAK